jgi:ribosome-associated protein
VLRLEAVTLVRDEPSDRGGGHRLAPLFRYDRRVLTIRYRLRSFVMPHHHLHSDPMHPQSPQDHSEVRTIELGQFIKWMNLADTGGQAKYLIQSGMVEVNGELETRRRRKLVAGDVVCVNDREFVVEFDNF